MEDWPMARQLRDAQCHTIWEGTENILCIDVRRAIRADGADAALLSRVERSLDGASLHSALSTHTDAVAATLAEAREAISWLHSAPEDLASLQLRRFSHLLADLAEGAVLLDEAAWSLENDGDARKALVGRLFARNHLAPPPLRGITDPDRSVIDLFEPLVRYGRIEPEDLKVA